MTCWRTVKGWPGKGTWTDDLVHLIALFSSFPSFVNIIWCQRPWIVADTWSSPGFRVKISASEYLKCKFYLVFVRFLPPLQGCKTIFAYLTLYIMRRKVESSKPKMTIVLTSIENLGSCAKASKGVFEKEMKMGLQLSLPPQLIIR
jgi:hypothetical protein